VATQKAPNSCNKNLISKLRNLMRRFIGSGSRQGFRSSLGFFSRMRQSCLVD
jgi:hypothetical protein